MFQEKRYYRIETTVIVYLDFEWISISPMLPDTECHAPYAGMYLL